MDPRSLITRPVFLSFLPLPLFPPHLSTRFISCLFSSPHHSLCRLPLPCTSTVSLLCLQIGRLYDRIGDFENAIRYYSMGKFVSQRCYPPPLPVTATTSISVSLLLLPLFLSPCCYYHICLYLCVPATTSVSLLLHMSLSLSLSSPPTLAAL